MEREALQPAAPITLPRYGEPTLIRPRLGQGAFRVTVTDVYLFRTVCFHAGGWVTVGPPQGQLRKQVVELVFGQIKQARGFRQFLLRGVKKVRAEWAMICTTHNLLKLFTLAKAA
jgi:hypothetical protein